jgi:hypothetical protein
MILDLRERGQDLGLAFGPAHWDEPPAAEVISIHELLPSELFMAQSIRARRLNAAVRRVSEAIVAGFGDISEAFI